MTTERRVMSGWVDPHYQGHERKHVAAVGKPMGSTYELVISDEPLVVVPESERALLTDEEQEFLKLTGRLAGRLCKIIGDGPQAEHDWSEAAAKIHDIQHMVMAQAAARAYPEQFRLLGNVGRWSEQ